MAFNASSHKHKQEFGAFSEIEPTCKRRSVCESSRLYDVFINHRGPDVKQTLATQLYDSLKQLEIRAFLDSEEKELGNSFPCTIETAIRSAKVHIAIFSKRYAQSPWCLVELVLMLQSKAKIIPVFYQVEPWELRRIEKGLYADAFIEYEKKGRYLEKLNEWKEALHYISFTAGEKFNSFSDWHCQKIVAAVRKEVQSKTYLHVATHPVGLNYLVKDFEEHVQNSEYQFGLEEGNREAKSGVVGIFGMGGSGKTTLAKELFNRYRKSFNYFRSSFLFDVREASGRNQLHYLQLQLLKDLFDDPRPNFRSTEEGTSYLKDCLQRSPPSSYLIVVDNIDDVEQLNALLVMDILNKFSNTLIIVTTRDAGVLITAGITVRYHLKGMNGNDGRELFCWHAFGQAIPCSGYKAMVDAFVDVCGGLPLSLQVLGQHVHGRDDRFWLLELNKVGEMLPRDIKQRLRISFDALDGAERQVFMDIACFFVGKPKGVAEKVWEGSGWNAQHALITLKDKCLVEEEKTQLFANSYIKVEVLKMHDHLRDLGREMALEFRAPRRLWCPQELKLLAADSEESKEKRTKSGESGGKEKEDLRKSKTEQSNSDNSVDSTQKSVKENSKASENQKQDYIHVRDRWGQPTYSHSLAKRVRREKISERIKYLQDLVPGCNKVTGKAVMLDENINYVQSLQRQVEAADSEESKEKRTKSGERGAKEKEDLRKSKTEQSNSDNSVDSTQKTVKENSKAFENKKQDYIHVRARRGQATDSHSLAERAADSEESKEKRTKSGERGAKEKADLRKSKTEQSNSDNSVDSTQKSVKENSKGFENQKQDYIHVQARQGQATYSHSLAERAVDSEVSKEKRTKSGESGAKEKKDLRKSKTEQSNSDNSVDSTQKSVKENSKASENQKQDYIHVRARRGQATDKHSLAERVRREKINERLKYLQDLVPGCNKGSCTTFLYIPQFIVCPALLLSVIQYGYRQSCYA